MFNKGDKINVYDKDSGKLMWLNLVVDGTELWHDVPSDDINYGWMVYADNPKRGKMERFSENRYTFKLVSAAETPEYEVPASRPFEIQTWNEFSHAWEINGTYAEWQAYVALNTPTCAPRPMNAFENLLSNAKFATVAPAADERAAFAAKSDAHYAALHLKSQDRDWQQAAYAALSHQTTTLTEIYAAIRAFDGSSREGDAAVLLKSGLAEMYIINGDKKFLLTERGYMVVWARGVSYFPNTIMAGLDTFMSVTEVATANKMTRRYINAEIERGNLVAQKIGNSYAIRREDYQKWLDNPKRGNRQIKEA